MRWTPCVAALAIGMCLPATAGAESVLDVYGELAQDEVEPAPLVPIRLPPSLRPIGRTLERFGTIGGRGYGLRFQGFGPDAVVALRGGEFRTMKGLLGESRRQGYTRSRTRVRGHRGYLLRRAAPGYALAWSERGVAYEIGTGTPRSVSLRQLRAMAKDLDRLGAAYFGSSEDGGSYAEAVTTRRTITLRGDYDDEACRRAGQEEVTLLRRSGNAFSFPFADDGWTGTASGTISRAAVELDLRATGTFDGQPCDTGPVHLTLPAR